MDTWKADAWHAVSKPPTGTPLGWVFVSEPAASPDAPGVQPTGAGAAAAGIRDRRGVVSFVRRSPRMNPSQQRALASLADRYLVELPRADLATSIAVDATFDDVRVFGRRAPLIVEIGCGVGDSLVPMAAARPETNLLAFEVYSPALASTMGKLDRAGVPNVRLMQADGSQGLRILVTPGALHELWTFFPDPWQKKRHHKRRLVNPEFAALAASRLAPRGLWRLATDWDDYANWMREVLDATPGLGNVYADAPGGWAPRPAERPITRFERRGLAAGRTVRDLVYRRVGDD